jgi:farnesol kinase
MCYFNIFGFVEKSWTMVGAFGAISLAAAVVESLPISTRLDDNLTVPLASVLVGALGLYFIGATNLCCMSTDDSSSSSSLSAVAEMVFAGSRSSK